MIGAFQGDIPRKVSSDPVGGSTIRKTEWSVNSTPWPILVCSTGSWACSPTAEAFSPTPGMSISAAYEKISTDGVKVIPIWNKSNREHEIIGTEPPSVRDVAAAAVKEAGWTGEWHVDADHINLGTVGRSLEIDGLTEPLVIDKQKAKAIARNYLPVVKDAGKIYRHILSSKGEGNFIAEVSMDETDTPQGPAELLLILAAIADEGIPAQTIAPRFSGRFNKGVEYVGDPKLFAAEFEADLMVLRYASEAFGLPENLKLSVHSGSDKFAIYPEIGRLLKKHRAGLHLKNAGTHLAGGDYRSGRSSCLPKQSA